MSELLLRPRVCIHRKTWESIPLHTARIEYGDGTIFQGMTFVIKGYKKQHILKINIRPPVYIYHILSLFAHSQGLVSVETHKGPIKKVHLSLESNGFPSFLDYTVTPEVEKIVDEYKKGNIPELNIEKSGGIFGGSKSASEITICLDLVNEQYIF